MVSDQQPQTGERGARVSTTTLMIATVLLLLVLAGAAIAAWVITRQPPENLCRYPRYRKRTYYFELLAQWREQSGLFRQTTINFVKTPTRQSVITPSNPTT